MATFLRRPLLCFLGALTMLLSITDSMAQSSRTQTSRRQTENSDLHKSMTAFGISTNTNSGIIGGVSLRHTTLLPGKFRGLPQYQYLNLEVVNVKSPKEITVGGGGYGGGLIAYKTNYLFAVRPQYGREVFFFNRHENEGMGLSGIFAIGPTIGVEKPYMVNYMENGRVVSVPYDPSMTGGISSAGFFKGFGKSKIVPGVHAKAAVNFEISSFRNSVTGVEVGFLAEAFTRKIELLGFPGSSVSSTDNKSFFTSGYVTLYFGGKK